MENASGADSNLKLTDTIPFSKCATWWFGRLKDQPHPFAALGVAMVISSYVNTTMGVAWPSEDTIAAELGISRITVSRAMKSLIAAGIISRQRRQRKSNTYCVRLDLPPGVTTEATQPDLTQTDTSEPLNASLGVKSSDRLMYPNDHLDVTPSPALDASPGVTGVDDNRRTIKDDVREKNDKENDERAIVAAKLKALGLRTSQIGEALRGHRHAAAAWACVDEFPESIASIPAFVFSSIRSDEMPPPPRREPPSRYAESPIRASEPAEPDEDLLDLVRQCGFNGDADQKASWALHQTSGPKGAHQRLHDWLRFAFTIGGDFDRLQFAVRKTQRMERVPAPDDLPRRSREFVHDARDDRWYLVNTGNAEADLDRVIRANNVRQYGLPA